MVNNTLNHHGIPGMKWGVRRFQNKDGSLTTAGKKRRGIIQTIKDNQADKKKQKQRTEALEKAREVKKTKAEEAAEKKRVLESGTAEEVLKYKGQLTNKELGDAYSRLNYERLITDISARESQAGAEKVDSLLSRTESTVNKIQRGVDTAQKSLDTYNKAAKIVNAMTKADLPTFEGNKKSKEAESALNKIVKSGTAEELTKQFGKLSSEQLKTATTRFANEKAIKGYADNEKAERQAAEAKSKVDKYNENWNKGVTEDSVRPTTYSKSGKDITDSKTDTKTKPEKVTGEVVGEGTSRSNIKNDSGYTKKDKPSDYYDPIDTTVSEARNSEPVKIGQNYIAGLLEDKSR